MRDRFITWGTRDGVRRLFTFELETEDGQIIRRILPSQGSSEETMQTVINAWTQMTTIHYPEGTETERISFAATGTIVPEGADVEDKVRVASAEKQWPFDVLSAQLRRLFRGELEELRDQINGLDTFDESLFERAKAAWDKVQAEVAAKNLVYEDSLALRPISDEMFATLKRLRRGESRRRQGESKSVKRELLADIAAAQTVFESKPDLRSFFNHLRELQAKVNSAALGRDDKNSLRDKLDELFKATKSEMNSSGADIKELSQKRQHLEHRLKGLQGAISRMRYSVERDNKDMYFEHRRLEDAGNQLMEQLAKAKLVMLGDQAKGKAARLDDMLATEADLLRKLDKLIASEARLESKRKANAAPEGAALVGSSDDAKVAQAKRSKTKARAGVDDRAGSEQNGPKRDRPKRERPEREPRIVTRRLLQAAAAVLDFVDRVVDEPNTPE